MPKTPTKNSLIRTFVRRERMSQARQYRLKHLMAKYGIDFNNASHFIDPETIFGRSAPLYLEIGFGNGEVLFELAAQHPEYDFIGIEVYRPGIENLLTRVDTAQLTNIRVIAEDARLILTNNIPNHSLTAILIFFPDPWPKRRHHKRRLLQNDFLNLVAPKLCRAGYLHFATDIEDYAKHALDLLTTSPNFAPLQDKSQTLPRPTSKFATRGTEAGRSTYDLIFTVTDNTNSS